MNLDERIKKINLLMDKYPKMKTACEVGGIVSQLTQTSLLFGNPYDDEYLNKINKKFDELEKLLKEL